MNRYISFFATLSIAQIIFFSVLESFAALFNPTLGHLLLFTKFLVVFIMVLYQNKYYSPAVLYRPFISFFLLYSTYVIIYLTILKVYPNDVLTGIPDSLSRIVYTFVLFFCYLYSAKAIFLNYSVKLLLIFSIPIVLLPSLFFLQYIGVDYLQMIKSVDEEDSISILALGYTNSTILVVSVLSIKSLFKKKLFGLLFVLPIIAIAGYVMIIGGERGPIIWCIVNIIICCFFLNTNIRKIIIIGVILIGIVFMSYDIIIEKMSEEVPRTAERIEKTISEGDNSGRFRLDDPYGGTYIIGINQFLSSPIWGSYFRLITDHPTFRGTYPHNIFIEVLITMGLLGFIPFLLLIWRAFTKSYSLLKRSVSLKKICIFSLFVAQFLELQTSNSILFNIPFWLFFYLLCGFPKLNVLEFKDS